MLGKVLIIDAFVAEARANIINAFKTAAEQALQRKFLRNAEIVILVERIHVGHERLCIGTAGGGFEDRRIDFDEAVSVHIIARGLPENRTALQAFADFGVHIHIDVAAAIALFLVRETIATRERAESFRQELNFVRKEREFAGAGAIDDAGGFDEIADVEEFYGIAF